MSVVTLDLAILAIDRTVADAVAEYIAKSAGIFSTRIGYTFVNKRYDDILVAANTVNETGRFYPQQAPGAPGALDTNKFFYGDGLLSIVPYNLSGQWSMEVLCYGVDGSAISLYYASNVVQPVVDNQLVKIDLPPWSIVAFDVVLETELASTISASVNVIWNGLYMVNA